MKAIDRVEQARRDREDAERRTRARELARKEVEEERIRALSAYPPPVVEGQGAPSAPHPTRVNSLGKETPAHEAFTNVWKIAGIIVAACAAGFGAAQALHTGDMKRIDALSTKLDENEKARQNDQRNTEHTIAGLHEEISLLKQALKIPEPLQVKAK